MAPYMLAMLLPFVLLGALILLDKLCGVAVAEARRAKMRARTRRSLRRRAKRNRAIQRRGEQ